MLSGFILQHSYRDSLNEVGAARFVALRATRLYPVHLFIIVALLLIVPFNEIEVRGTLTEWRVLATAFLVQAWSLNRDVNFAVNPPAWSISVELFFYSCFPLISRAAVRRPLLTVLAPLAAVTCFVLLVPPVGTPRQWLSVYMMNPVVRIPEFILGVGLYELRARWMTAKGSVNRWSLAEVTSLLFVAALNAACWPSYNWLGAHIGTPFRDWVMFDVGTTPAFCVVIVVFSLRRGIVNRLLDIKPLVFLGEISFAIYMLHVPILQLGRMWGWTVEESLVATIIAAAIAHLFIERPSINLAKRMLRRNRTSRYAVVTCGDENTPST